MDHDATPDLFPILRVVILAPIDTVAFGRYADGNGLRTIADANGVRFVQAH